MPRFLGVLVVALTLGFVGSASAKPGSHSVPELATTGAAGGIALIAGVTAVALGRRRARKR